MSKKTFLFFLVALLMTSMTSCLTCEKKEYVFEITGPNSGKLTIRFINIFSNSLDSTAELDADYSELTAMWLKGEKIERDYPKATHIRKRLFEQNGQLCGEVTMEFRDLKDVRLYRYQQNGPYMISLNATPDDGENFLQTNGEYGGENMPVVFWPDDSRTLRLTTYIARPDSTTVSMLDFWKRDKKEH